MILVDTGPLIALENRNDPEHAACRDLLARHAPIPLLTTWACFTEAMYLLGRMGGIRYQEHLWKIWQAGSLRLHDLDDHALRRCARLMTQYADFPMHLADATLLVASESLGIDHLVTFDQGFRAFRRDDESTLVLWPWDMDN